MQILLDDAGFFPPGEEIAFHRREIDLGRDILEGRHVPKCSCQKTKNPPSNLRTGKPAVPPRLTQCAHSIADGTQVRGGSTVTGGTRSTYLLAGSDDGSGTMSRSAASARLASTRTCWTAHQTGAFSVNANPDSSPDRLSGQRPVSTDRVTSTTRSGRLLITPSTRAATTFRIRAGLSIVQA